MADTTHMRPMNYPAMSQVAAGGQPEPTVDSSGRVQTRMDEAPVLGGKTPGATSGAGRGKWTQNKYIPILRDVASENGIPARLAGGAEVMGLIKKFGGTPESLARYFHTTDPKEQARFILRMARRI